jgi:hypothetical protein
MIPQISGRSPQGEAGGVCKRRAVTGAKRVLEARAITSGIAVAHVDRNVVDDKLVARCGDTARIAVFGFSDAETSIEGGQVVINASLVRLHHGLRVCIQLGT